MKQRSVSHNTSRSEGFVDVRANAKLMRQDAASIVGRGDVKSEDQKVLTLKELNDIEAIKRVKYAYLRCLDQKDWAGMVDVFAPEATAAYSGGKYSFEGRDEIVAFFERSMGRETFLSSHRVHHPEIDLDGDFARATWALEDTVVDSQWNFVLTGSAFYEDDLVRQADGWVITRTAYKRIFEMIYPLDSIDGLKLTASWWGTDGRSELPGA